MLEIGNHGITQGRRDLRRSLVQPLSQSRVSCGVRPGCSGLYPVWTCLISISYGYTFSYPPILHHWKRVWLHFLDNLPASAEGCCSVPLCATYPPGWPSPAPSGCPSQNKHSLPYTMWWPFPQNFLQFIHVFPVLEWGVGWTNYQITGWHVFATYCAY